MSWFTCVSASCRVVIPRWHNHNYSRMIDLRKTHSDEEHRQQGGQNGRKRMMVHSVGGTDKPVRQVTSRIRLGTSDIPRSETSEPVGTTQESPRERERQITSCRLGRLGFKQPFCHSGFPITAGQESGATKVDRLISMLQVATRQSCIRFSDGLLADQLLSRNRLENEALKWHLTTCCLCPWQQYLLPAR